MKKLFAILFGLSLAVSASAQNADIKGSTTQVSLLSCTNYVTSATGSAVDMKDYIGRVAVLLHSSAAVVGTNATLDVKLQDSADGSTGWADISGATFTQVTTNAAFEAIGVIADSAKRYWRVYATNGDTSQSYYFGVSAVGRKQSN